MVTGLYSFGGIFWFGSNVILDLSIPTEFNKSKSYFIVEETFKDTMYKTERVYIITELLQKNITSQWYKKPHTLLKNFIF